MEPQMDFEAGLGATMAPYIDNQECSGRRRETTACASQEL